METCCVSAWRRKERGFSPAAAPEGRRRYRRYLVIISLPFAVRRSRYIWSSCRIVISFRPRRRISLDIGGGASSGNPAPLLSFEFMSGFLSSPPERLSVDIAVYRIENSIGTSSSSRLCSNSPGIGGSGCARRIMSSTSPSRILKPELRRIR